MKLRTKLRSPLASPKSIEEVGSDTLRPDRMSTQCNTIRTPISVTFRESNTPISHIETEFGRIRRINDGFKHKKRTDRDKEAQILTSSNGISYPLDSHHFTFKNEPQSEEFLHAIGYLNSKNPRKLPTDFDSLREMATRQREIPLSPVSKREAFLFPEKSELGLPAGRRDAQVLGAWLDSMLGKILNSNQGSTSSIQESAKLIYTVCFNEIVRQVSVNCVERGRLMDKVWNGYISLLEKAIVYSEKKQNKLVDKFKREKENITSYLNGIISKLRKENAELLDNNSNLSQKLKVEHENLLESQEKESRLIKNLKLLQLAYKSTKKQLLIYKEDRRILLERIQNLDRIELIEKPVVKKVKVKNFEDIENLMKSDPLYDNISQGLDREIADVMKLLKENDMITRKFDEDDYEDKAVNTEIIKVANQEIGTELEFTCGEIGVEVRENRNGREDEVGELVENAQIMMQNVEEEIMRITQDLPTVLAQYEDQLNDLISQSLEKPNSPEIKERRRDIVSKFTSELHEKVESIVSQYTHHSSNILTSICNALNIKLQNSSALPSLFKFSQISTKKKAKLYNNIISTSRKKLNQAELLIRKIRSTPTDKLQNIMMKKILLKLITSMYQERIDLAKANPQVYSTDFCSFVWDSLTKRYGVLNVVKRKYSLILSTCMKYASISRINLFGRFLQLYDGLDTHDLNICLQCIEFVNNGFMVRNAVDYSEVVLVPYNRILEAFKNFLQPVLSFQDYEKLVYKLSMLKTTNCIKFNEEALSIDVALQCAMNILRKKKDGDLQFIRDIYDSGDLNRDGFLEYKELELILRHISRVPYDYSTSQEMFRRYAENFCTEDDSYVQAVSFESFCGMVREFKLFSPEKLEEFAGVRGKDEVMKRLQDLAQNIEPCLENIKNLFSRNKEWESYLDDLEEMFSNLKNSVVNNDSPLVAWLAYRLMEEESRRVAMEDLSCEERSCGENANRSQEGLSFVAKLIGERS